MFKSQEDQIAVLGVGVETPNMLDQSGDVNFMSMQSGRRAIDMLRMMHFDFLLVGIGMQDVSTWDFLRHLKTAWPQLKWALVGSQISEQQEITARMFGATLVMDAMPSADEIVNLTSHIRDRARENVLAGRFGAQVSSRPARAAAI